MQGERKKVKDARIKDKGFRIKKKVSMRFEDLEVWKRAARLSAEIFNELEKLKNFGFRDQITRAGLSIPSNIAERFERESKKECIQFLSYARGSCGEL